MQGVKLGSGELRGVVALGRGSAATGIEQLDVQDLELLAEGTSMR